MSKEGAGPDGIQLFVGSTSDLKRATTLIGFDTRELTNPHQLSVRKVISQRELVDLDTKYLGDRVETNIRYIEILSQKIGLIVERFEEYPHRSTLRCSDRQPCARTGRL
uniref:hypothetical protein n=1 Tax=Nocardia caishijiensis TaxID=184756 RepID=UPI0012EE8BD3|nr:hypothetical protein [Nocardia caishijiensis]